MDILYIIGNGFDLNLGLKTSYHDFYKYYQGIESESENVNNLKKTISKDLKNWSDLELALGQYTENFKSDPEFIEAFEDIGDNLADYLQIEEDNFDISNVDRNKLINDLIYPEKSLLKSDLDKITSFKNGWVNYQWNINVITFNYTKLLENILREKQSNSQIGSHNSLQVVLQKVEHIHGYIDERMVMGVNDVTQIANATFHNNQDILEAFVKNHCNQTCKHSIDDLFNNLINGANLICIFGSSIGDTDNLWWERIVKQLLRSDFKLIIFQKNNNVSKRRLYQIGSIERLIKESLINRLNMKEEEKKHAINNIFISVNSDMFKLIEKAV